MATSRRLGRLGSGVFDRNDRRKQAYRFTTAGTDALPLVDLSLGSTDLLPPDVALKAIEVALRTPESSSYCLHAATRPFREAVATWSQRRFGVSVDPDREVLLLVGSQEGNGALAFGSFGSWRCCLDPRSRLPLTSGGTGIG